MLRDERDLRVVLRMDELDALAFDDIEQLQERGISGGRHRYRESVSARSRENLSASVPIR
jgi:hypothetical protein